MLTIQLNNKAIETLMEKARKGSHLVPEKRMVNRGGKTFQMTVWVDPRDKTAPAQGGFDFDEKPVEKKKLTMTDVRNIKDPIEQAKAARIRAEEETDRVLAGSEGESETEKRNEIRQEMDDYTPDTTKQDYDSDTVTVEDLEDIKYKDYNPDEGKSEKELSGKAIKIIKDKYPDLYSKAETLAKTTFDEKPRYYNGKPYSTSSIRFDGEKEATQLGDSWPGIKMPMEVKIWEIAYRLTKRNKDNKGAKDTPKDITALNIVKDIKVTKVRKNALNFTYKGKNFVFTKYGVLARATKQEDGKTRYSYGSFGDDVKYSVAEEVRDMFVTSRKYDEKASKGYPEHVFTYKGDISKKPSNESLEQKSEKENTEKPSLKAEAKYKAEGSQVYNRDAQGAWRKTISLSSPEKAEGYVEMMNKQIEVANKMREELIEKKKPKTPKQKTTTRYNPSLHKVQFPGALEKSLNPVVLIVQRMLKGKR